MNILHYTLGLPPYRSGGLTKYATDLMIAQSEVNNVSLLYPGGTSLCFKKRFIRQRSSYDKIALFEIRNPLMVPLLYGVSNPMEITDSKTFLSENSMTRFLDKIKPDVFHIHTWMGLPKELVLFMKEHGVKIVYTSHDYYGLCPKVNFIDHIGKPCSNICEESCSACNAMAPSTKFLRMRNLPLVLKVKNWRITKKLMNKIEV